MTFDRDVRGEIREGGGASLRCRTTMQTGDDSKVKTDLTWPGYITQDELMGHGVLDLKSIYKKAKKKLVRMKKRAAGSWFWLSTYADVLSKSKSLSPSGSKL